MEKLLPMAIPPSETYQLQSFMMGIMLQNKNVRNVLFNSYINLYISENAWDKVTLEFTDAECEPYRLTGIGEMDLFYLQNISKEKCKDFLKERIEQDNYLLLFEIDEYELSYSEYYKKRHFIHDTYVYGYDDTHFYVMAYSHGHLRLLKVPEQEIIDGLYSQLNEESHFCSFRVYHKAKVKLSIKKILSQVDNYLVGGKNELGETVGISVYDYLQQTLTEVENDRNEDDMLNPRVFRMLWEHKKMILFRNLHLAERIATMNDLIPTAKKLEQQGTRVMLMMLKFNLKHDYDIVNRIKINLAEMKDIEKGYWCSFSKILQNQNKIMDNRKKKLGIKIERV